MSKIGRKKSLSETERIEKLKESIEQMKVAGFKDDIIGIYCMQLKELEAKENEKPNLKFK